MTVSLRVPSAHSDQSAHCRGLGSLHYSGRLRGFVFPDLWYKAQKASFLLPQSLVN